jgi:hypothetical protein
MDTTFKLDLKTLVVIITFATGLAGVYYSFQSRLEAVEEDVSALEQRMNPLEKKVNRLNRKGKSK